MRTKDWIETEGTIGGIERESTGKSNYDSVVFTYKVDGHFYGGTFSASSNTYKVGDTLSVKYDLTDPDRNDLVRKETITHWIVGGIGALLVVGYVLAHIYLGVR